MTLAQEFGLEVGTIAYVTNPEAMKEWWGIEFAVNDLVSLNRDDDSHAPLFDIMTGENAGQALFLPLDGLSLTPANVEILPEYQSPAQKMGLRVGDVAYVVHPREAGLGNLETGDVVELNYDDSSTCPSFNITTGYHAGEVAYLNVTALSVTAPVNVAPELRREDLVEGEFYLVTNALPSNREFFQNGDVIKFTGQVSNSSSGMAYFIGKNGEEYAMYIDEISVYEYQTVNWPVTQEPVAIEVVTPIIEVPAPIYYKVVNADYSNPEGFQNGDIVTPSSEYYEDGYSGFFDNNSGVRFWLRSGEIELYQRETEELIGSGVNEVITNSTWGYAVEEPQPEAQPETYQIGDFFRIIGSEGTGATGDIVVMVGDCCITPMIDCHNFRMGHSMMKLKVNLEKISYLEALEELNKPVQTLCESMGFNVGDMFVIVSDNDAFEEHEIVTLIEDDGTDEPRFFGSNSTRGDKLSISHVRKLSKEEAQEELVAMYELPFMHNFVKYAA